MEQAAISIIMPVYNMSQYLDEVLESWCSQTFPYIQIICVDDASTDDSLDLLKKWAKKDSRILLHHFDKNVSAWAARKWGICHSHSKYIMFADADDTIVSTACEELYREMEHNPVDILHFNATIVNAANLPDARIQSMERFAAPYHGFLKGDEVFRACFQEEKYRFTLWNKIFRAELCKQAVEGTPDYYLPKAQDALLYWAVALHAASYRGLPKKKLYNYYFGRGATGHNYLNIAQFTRYCTAADVSTAMHEYLEKLGVAEKYHAAEVKAQTSLVMDCMARFINELDEESKPEGFDIFVKKWGTSRTIAALAQSQWFNCYKMAQSLKGAECLRYDGRTPKVIAAYYHSIANGGAQRVVCDLCSIFIKMGYQVVLFTDELASPEDYPLPKSIQRVVLPHNLATNRDNYYTRASFLESKLKEYRVDAMLYHAWVSNLMLWDELTCKVNNVAFIGHCHNVFSLPVLRGYDSVQNVVAPYILADAVVTLSQTDRYFWKHFNPNVYETINPFTEGAENWKPSEALDKKEILWVGRLSPEKRPRDALDIMCRVLDEIPDAHLSIVGSSPNEDFMKNYQHTIQKLGLSHAVTLHGFQPNVQNFYRNSSIFLMTSEYEGYPLALQESKMAGLPCVMYELPYVTLCQGNRGILPIPSFEPKDAADAIIKLLQNDRMRHQYAKDARNHIEEYFSFDFNQKWADIFRSLSEEHKDDIPEVSHIMIETLLAHHEICLRNQKSAFQKKAWYSAMPCKLRGGIQCCIDHGVPYTIRYAFVKLGRRIRKVFQRNAV